MILKILKNSSGYCVPYSVKCVLGEGSTFDLNFLKGVLGDETSIQQIHDLRCLGLGVKMGDPYAGRGLLEDYLRKGLPVLLFAQDHAVVAYGLAREKVFIWDSNIGDVVVSKEELDNFEEYARVSGF